MADIPQIHEIGHKCRNTFVQDTAPTVVICSRNGIQLLSLSESARDGSSFFQVGRYPQAISICAIVKRLWGLTRTDGEIWVWGVGGGAACDVAKALYHRVVGHACSRLVLYPTLISNDAPKSSLFVLYDGYRTIVDGLTRGECDRAEVCLCDDVLMQCPTGVCCLGLLGYLGVAATRQELSESDFQLTVAEVLGCLELLVAGQREELAFQEVIRVSAQLVIVRQLRELVRYGLAPAHEKAIDMKVGRLGLRFSAEYLILGALSCLSAPKHASRKEQLMEAICVAKRGPDARRFLATLL